MNPCYPAKFEKSFKKKRSKWPRNMMPTFCPVEASTRKASPRRIDVNSELLQPIRSLLGHLVFLLPRWNPQAQPLCCLINFDANPASKMHVATASKSEHLCVSRISAEGSGKRSNYGQRFDQRCDFRTGEAVIPMFPLWLDGEQVPVNQLRQMGARGLGRDSRHKSQAACRQCTPVHQRDKHSGARIVSRQCGNARDLKFHVRHCSEVLQRSFRRTTNHSGG